MSCGKRDASPTRQRFRPRSTVARRTTATTPPALTSQLLSVRMPHRLNSVFETEFSLSFLPIFRNDAMALVGSQGNILSTMASISSENVAARGDGV